MYYDMETLEREIINHMRSIKLTKNGNKVSKGSIILSVSNNLKMDESEDYLIEEAFNDLLKGDIVRSSYRKYDENGKLKCIVRSTDEEKFYLK